MGIHHSMLRKFIVIGILTVASSQTLGSFTRTINTSNQPTLRISNRAGDMRVTGESQDMIEIKGTIVKNYRLSYPATFDEDIAELKKDPPIIVDGDIITIQKIDADLAKYIHINYDLNVPGRTNLETETGSGDIQVSRLQSKVDLSTGSGDIRLEDLSEGGNVSTGSGDVSGFSTMGKLLISTGSGDLNFSDCGGEYILSTGSGDIRMNFANDGKVDISSGSGDMQLTHLIGIARAHVSSGDITISGYPTGAWSLQSSSGDVELDLTEDAGANLDAKSSSGDININLQVQIVKSQKHALQAIINQGGPDLRVRTSSGDIHIY